MLSEPPARDTALRPQPGTNGTTPRVARTNLKSFYRTPLDATRSCGGSMSPATGEAAPPRGRRSAGQTGGSGVRISPP